MKLCGCGEPMDRDVDFLGRPASRCSCCHAASVLARRGFPTTPTGSAERAMVEGLRRLSGEERVAFLFLLVRRVARGRLKSRDGGRFKRRAG